MSCIRFTIFSIILSQWRFILTIWENLTAKAFNRTTGLIFLGTWFAELFKIYSNFPQFSIFKQNVNNQFSYKHAALQDDYQSYLDLIELKLEVLRTRSVICCFIWSVFCRDNVTGWSTDLTDKGESKLANCQKKEIQWSFSVLLLLVSGLIISLRWDL